MKIISQISELDENTRAILEHIATGNVLDPAIAKRVREEAQKITDQLFQNHGLLDIGVPAIRELRGEFPE